MPRLKPAVLCVVSVLSMAGCAAPSKRQAQPPVQPPAAARPAITADAMYRMGRYYEGQARYDKAIAGYRGALMRNPLLIDAYAGLGRTLAAQQRYEEAIRQFRAAVVLAPHAASAHNNLGYAYLLNGSHADAVKAFEEAIRLDPEHERSRENLRVAQAGSEAPIAQPAAEPSADASLVEVAPQVFELKAPGRHPRIEAVPLPLLPEEQPRAASSRYFGLEVSNGNGVPGLAGRVAARLANAGVRTGWLTNQLPFRQAKTEVHYRQSYATEAAELVKKLRYPVRMVANDALAPHVDVRLVLGNDVRSETAFLQPGAERTAVVMRD